MKSPLFVRRLTVGEASALQSGLRDGSAFVLKRCQILLASSQGKTVPEIRTTLGHSAQSIRNIIHTFNQEGLTATLTRRSNRPRSGRTAQPLLDASKGQDLEQILRQEPRVFGKDTSLWTLTILAEVAYAQGLTSKQLSPETIRRAVKRLGWGWKRAKAFIASPDPAYTRKKSVATAS